jgi:hypothetical protein
VAPLLPARGRSARVEADAGEFVDDKTGERLETETMIRNDRRLVVLTAPSLPAAVPRGLSSGMVNA